MSEERKQHWQYIGGSDSVILARLSRQNVTAESQQLKAGERRTTCQINASLAAGSAMMRAELTQALLSMAVQR